jgi:hypothetical protein
MLPSIYINLTIEAIEVQSLDIVAKRLDVRSQVMSGGGHQVHAR